MSKITKKLAAKVDAAIKKYNENELITTQKQIDKITADVRRNGIPDSLNRWIGMTPALLVANKAQRTRITNQQKRMDTMSKVGTKEAALREQRGSVTTPATTNLTEKDKVAIVEIQAQKEAKVEAKAKAKAEEKKENKKIREKQKAAIKAGEVVTKPTTVTAIAKVTPEPKTAAPKKTNGTAKTTEHKGAFTAKVIDDLMPMVKKGTTLGALISAARWGSCGNPVRRATRFITTVAQGDFGLKVKIEGDGEEAKVKVA